MKGDSLSSLAFQSMIWYAEPFSGEWNEADVRDSNFQIKDVMDYSTYADFLHIKPKIDWKE